MVSSFSRQENEMGKPHGLRQKRDPPQTPVQKLQRVLAGDKGVGTDADKNTPSEQTDFQSKRAETESKTPPSLLSRIKNVFIPEEPQRKGHHIEPSLVSPRFKRQVKETIKGIGSEVKAFGAESRKEGKEVVKGIKKSYDAAPKYRLNGWRHIEKLEPDGEWRDTGIRGISVHAGEGDFIDFDSGRGIRIDEKEDKQEREKDFGKSFTGQFHTEGGIGGEEDTEREPRKSRVKRSERKSSFKTGQFDTSAEEGESRPYGQIIGSGLSRMSSGQFGMDYGSPGAAPVARAEPLPPVHIIGSGLDVMSTGQFRGGGGVGRVRTREEQEAADARWQQQIESQPFGAGSAMASGMFRTRYGAPSPAAVAAPQPAPSAGRGLSVMQTPQPAPAAEEPFSIQVGIGGMSSGAFPTRYGIPAPAPVYVPTPAPAAGMQQPPQPTPQQPFGAGLGVMTTGMFPATYGEKQAPPAQGINQPPQVGMPYMEPPQKFVGVGLDAMHSGAHQATYGAKKAPQSPKPTNLPKKKKRGQGAPEEFIPEAAAPAQPAYPDQPYSAFKEVFGRR